MQCNNISLRLLLNVLLLRQFQMFYKMALEYRPRLLITLRVKIFVYSVDSSSAYLFSIINP